MRQIKITERITERNSKAIDSYLTEMSHYQQITTDEEVTLAQQIREGGEKGQKALDKLVTSNLRFVVSVAKQYQNHGLSLCDLINEGNIGLIKAAKLFDETRGFKFISYAVWWIRQAILQAISSNSRLVRLPQNQINLMSKVNKIKSKANQEVSDDITASAIADELNTTLDKIEDLESINSYHVSIDASISDTDKGTIADTLASESVTDESLTKEALRIELDSALSSLKNRDKDILYMLFGINCEVQTLEEVGNKFDISPERVRQIKEAAIKKLRKTDLTKLRLFL